MYRFLKHSFQYLQKKLSPLCTLRTVLFLTGSLLSMLIFSGMGAISGLMLGGTPGLVVGILVGMGVGLLLSYTAYISVKEVNNGIDEDDLSQAPLRSPIQLEREFDPLTRNADVNTEPKESILQRIQKEEELLKAKEEVPGGAPSPSHSL